ncbi:uncharacterized protein LOC101176140 [Nomascus leucogenys]|uniref:uncharacterized protein LOC101176140 n=1 Tax=Nomascus leucogenys TaxID=61853 RepID=UPI00122D59E8|nr:uncharacterized protein LOC101176140 [Nomascus leucogenys]
MQRGPLSPSPSDGPGALGTTYPGVHRGQGMAGLRVPAFNAGLRPITPSRAETQPPETTSSGMHREPLSSTPIAHWEGAQSPGAQSVLAMLVHRTATHTLRVLEPKKDPQRELPATHRSWAPARQPSPLHSIRQTTPAKPSLVKRERRNQALAREVPWFPQRAQWKTSEGPGSSSGRRGRR